MTNDSRDQERRARFFPHRFPLCCTATHGSIGRRTGRRSAYLFMTLIPTAELCGANSFDYLTELQRHPQQLPVSRAEWMPGTTTRR